MYNVSQNFHSLIASGAEQNLLLTFDDVYFSHKDRDFESSGAELSEYFNTATDIAIGEVPSSIFSVALMNYDNALSQFEYGEGRPYIGVKTGTGTYTRPSGATAYATWKDSNNTSHTIVGYDDHATIDGTSVTTGYDAVTLIWARDDDVYIQCETLTYIYEYANGSWTGTQGTLNAFMATKPSTGVTWQNNLMTIYLEDGTTEEWEYCPLGVFTFDTPSMRQIPVIEIDGYDRMVKFEKDPDDFLDELEYPITLHDLYEGLCEFCEVPYDDAAFTNDDIEIAAEPSFSSSITCRDILSRIAEASGTVAKVDRDGVLHLAWFGDTSVATLGATDIEVNGYRKVDYLSPEITRLVIKSADGMATIVGTGTVDYPILGNPFLGTDSTQNTAILTSLASVDAYSPMTASIISADPSVEAGDLVTILSNPVPLMSQSLTWRGSDTRAVYTATGNPTREPVPYTKRMDFAIQEAINAAADESLKHMIYENTTALSVADSVRTRVLRLYFEMDKESYLSIDMEFLMTVAATASSSSSYVVDPVTGEVTVTATIPTTDIDTEYYYDGVETSGHNPEMTCVDGKHIMRVRWDTLAAEQGAHVFEVWFTADGGSVTLPIQGINAWVDGTGLGGEAPWDGTLEFEDTITPLTFTLATITDSTPVITLQVPTPITASDTISALTFSLATITDEANVTMGIYVTPTAHVSSQTIPSSTTVWAATADGQYVDSVEVTNMTGFSAPTGRQLSYMASFDGGTTWKGYDGIGQSWITDLTMTYETISSITTWQSPVMIRAIFDNAETCYGFMLKGASV